MANATKKEVVVVPEKWIPAVKETTYTLELNQKEAETLLSLVGLLAGTFAGRKHTGAIYDALENKVYNVHAHHTDWQATRRRYFAGMRINGSGVGL